MGRPDLYPFVLAPRVVEKLRFVHGLVRRVATSAASRTERSEQLETAAR
jgi:hypothetical protein